MTSHRPNCFSWDLWWKTNVTPLDHAPFNSMSSSPFGSEEWCHWERSALQSLPSGGGLTWLLFTHRRHLNLRKTKKSHAAAGEGFQVTGEVKHHVYVKRQTRICTTWPSFPFTYRLRFIISTHKLSSFTQFFIHNNCFEFFLFARFLFWEILNLNVTFAVYVNLKLSTIEIKWPGAPCICLILRFASTGR